MEEHFKNKLKNHKVDWDKEELLGNLKQELSHGRSKFNWRWFLLLPLLFLATCWGVSNWKVSNVESIAQVDGAHNEISDSEIGHKKTEAFDTNREEIKAKDELSTQLEKNLTVEMTDASFSSIEKERVSVVFISSKIQEKEIQTSKLHNINDSNFQPEVTQSLNTLTNNSEQSRVVKSEELNKNEMSLLSALPMNASPIEYEVDFALPENRISVDEIRPIKKAIDAKNSFFVAGSAEVGMVFRVANSMADNLESIDPLVSKEKSFNASNIKIGYQHQSGLSLASGLEYNQIREFLKFDIPFGSETFSTADESGSFFYDENFEKIYFVDSMTVVETTIRKIRHNNKHTFLSVPVQLGFQKSMGRADVFGTVGASYAFLHNFKGREIQLMDGGGTTVVDELEFKVKNRIGLQLGVGAEYPIFNKTISFLTLNYRRSPTLQFYENNELFYHSLSLGTGVRYSFR